MQEETFEELMELAGSLLGNPDSAADLAQANDCINQALFLKPDAGQAWLLKSQIMSNMTDDPSALAAVEMAVRRLPQSAEAHFTRGWVLCDLEQFDEALSAVERAFEYLTPEEAGALEEDLYFLKGALLDALGRADDAMAIFEAGLIRHPDSEMLRGGLEPLRRERMRSHLHLIDGGRP